MPQGQGQCQSMSHVSLIVGNAKLSAIHYCTHFGFSPFKYRGLENGHRTIASHAIKCGSIILVFISSLVTNVETDDIHRHLTLHGDSVIDIAFNVDNFDELIDHIRKRGGHVLCNWTESDSHGFVRMAKVKTNYGDVTHTLIERNNYPDDLFLPKWGHSPLGYLENDGVILSQLPTIPLQFIDHVAVNQNNGMMQSVAKWYEDSLRFHRFWSVDDTLIQMGVSGLRSTFMTIPNEPIVIGINEPGEGIKTSQIQEYLDYHNGPGVQHIAFHTNDICRTVHSLERRGVEFLTVPNAYYENLSKRLQSSSVNVSEDLDQLKKLKILVDFDDNGYLLQIFTKPMQDRPTLFLEIIERHNFNGFGAGNIKALFHAIESEQKLRGNL